MGDIFGRNPVLEALKSKRTINKIWLAKGEQKGSVHEILALAKEQKITVQSVERSKLDKMFPRENSSVCCFGRLCGLAGYCSCGQGQRRRSVAGYFG